MSRSTAPCEETADVGIDTYVTALRRTLENPAEPALGEAYQLGRSALNQRRGLVDLVLLHHTALADAVPEPATDLERRQMLNAAGEFLAESLSPFEMAYRGFFEANAALVGVNGTLEREARRVARLLHDGAGQIVFGLQLALAELDRSLPSENAQLVAEIRALVQQLDEQLHSHSRELYPVVLEDLGLQAAIGQLIQSLARRATVDVSFECSLDSRPSSDTEFAVYRGVQEALTNALKHSGARHILVTLVAEQGVLRCSVSDDGIGGVAERRSGAGLGLISIRERMKLVHGDVDIRSVPGEGTEVVLTAPALERSVTS